jgi:heptaprenyl diphosphate synthase
MDSAELRRSAPSANAVYDNSVAIMVGDFLFARASSVVATLGTDFVAVQAETFARLVQGQIAELLGPRGSDPVEHHLAVVADKTGSLIATSARFGGMVAGLGEEELDALTRFGEEIGVVFQLSDDLIDITSDTTGKTPGTDLREGVQTLATLTVAASTDPADAELKGLVSGPLSEPEVERALTLLRSHRVIAETRAEIARRAEVARSCLVGLPEGPAKRGLDALCDTVVTRSA